MTVEEFKKIKPEFASLEGNDLWGAMEDYMISQKRADEILKQIQPIWKTHTVRWLFYRRLEHVFITPNTKYHSPEVCKNCKNGCTTYAVFMDFQNKTHACYCLSCSKELVKVKNTTWQRKIYLAYSFISSYFWLFLDKIKLVRSSIHGRYEMFGDEYRYVRRLVFDKDFNVKKTELRPRKWWEYIIIEKPHHNF